VTRGRHIASALDADGADGVTSARERTGLIDADNAAARETAHRIEQDYPSWFIHFGSYSQQFVAFPLFTIPGLRWIESESPRDLVRQIWEIEGLSARPGGIPVASSR
jgi:hypothetical protein